MVRGILAVTAHQLFYVTSCWAQGRTVFVLLRAANLAFFLATATYGILSFGTFSYQQFIKPEVLPWPSWFAFVHPPLFWLCSSLTAWSLLPHLAGERRQRAAIGYVSVSVAVGVALAWFPLLNRLGNDGYSLGVGLLALMFPIALAIVDHRTSQSIEPTLTCDRHALRTCVVTGLATWMAYAAAAPIRLGNAVGINLDARSLLVSWTVSAAAHLAVFTVVFLVLTLVFRAARRTARPGRFAYWLTLAIVAGSLAVVLEDVVFDSLAFAAWTGWLAALALSTTVVLTWSGAVRHVVTRASHVPRDVLGTLSAPLAAFGPRAARALAVVAIPLGALGSGNLFAQLDWNFLFQKLTVFGVWAGAFGLVHAAVDRPRRPVVFRFRSMRLSAGVLVAIAAIFATLPRVSAWTGDRKLVPELLFDQYAAIDPSFHFMRDVMWIEAPDGASFYGLLKAHSVIDGEAIRPIDIDFVRPLEGTGNRPHIFLFVIDSLRRDYLSPYNPEVTFTPAIDRFARESIVFERAFSRYSGTGLSMPSIWAGGMLLHTQYIRPFAPMNALEKLLDVNGYRRVFSPDHITRQLLTASERDVHLDRGVLEMRYDLCRTLGELETTLDRTFTGDAPVFAHTRSLNLHIGNVASEGGKLERTGAFVAPVVDRVRAMDRCLGRFLDFLKRRALYDESIVIVTSDHGDSLGEDGRWGHSYTIFPESMRIPLIVHLPARFSGRAAADEKAVSFSSDITPTLYALLGYQPRDLGSLYGRPLVALDGGTPPARTRTSEQFLLAASYGAVYGLLSDEGRSLYIVDAVSGRDYAFDLGGGSDVRLTITDAMRASRWDVIRRQVHKLSAQYGYRTES
jgi:Sulfatase